MTVSGGIITLIYAEVLRWTEKRKQKVAERKEVVEMEVVEMDDKESNIPSATLQSSSTLRQRNVVSSESIVPPPLVVQNNFHLSIFQIIFTLL